MKSLTDVVSGAGLSVYAEVALVIFLIAFLGIVLSLFAPGRRHIHEHMRQLPIEGDKDTDPSFGTTAIPRFARNDIGARNDTSARDDQHA
jgi:cbb3-type cytochrome oxidase subunit 3